MATIRQLISSFCLLSLVTLGTVTQAREAGACPGIFGHESIFFNVVPLGPVFQDARGRKIDLTAATILRVTILSKTQLKPGTVHGQARIEQVIQGQLEADPLKIVIGRNSCGPTMQAGSQGLIIGAPRHLPTGELEFIPVVWKPWLMKKNSDSTHP